MRNSETIINESSSSSTEANMTCNLSKEQYAIILSYLNEKYTNFKTDNNASEWHITNAKGNYQITLTSNELSINYSSSNNTDKIDLIDEITTIINT